MKIYNTTIQSLIEDQYRLIKSLVDYQETSMTRGFLQEAAPATNNLPDEIKNLIDAAREVPGTEPVGADPDAVKNIDAMIKTILSTEIARTRRSYMKAKDLAIEFVIPEDVKNSTIIGLVEDILNNMRQMADSQSAGLARGFITDDDMDAVNNLLAIRSTILETVQGRIAQSYMAVPPQAT